LVVRLAAGMRDSEFVPIVCCLRTGPLAARLEQEGIYTLGQLRRAPESALWPMLLVREPDL